jgi:hypothetical protein
MDSNFSFFRVRVLYIMMSLFIVFVAERLSLVLQLGGLV